MAYVCEKIADHYYYLDFGVYLEAERLNKVCKHLVFHVKKDQQDLYIGKPKYNFKDQMSEIESIFTRISSVLSFVTPNSCERAILKDELSSTYMQLIKEQDIAQF